MEAIRHEFVWGDVVADVAGRRCVRDEVSDHVPEVMLRSGDLLVAVQQGCQLPVVVAMRFVDDQRVCLEHGLEALGGAAGLIASGGELREVAAHLSFMPRGEDRLDIREVLVQGRPSDPCELGDLGHRYGPQAVPGDQVRGRVESRLPNRAAVGLDRVVPELWHRVEYTV